MQNRTKRNSQNGRKWNPTPKKRSREVTSSKRKRECMDETTKKKEVARMARYNCVIKKGRRKWKKI